MTNEEWKEALKPVRQARNNAQGILNHMLVLNQHLSALNIPDVDTKPITDVIFDLNRAEKVIHRNREKASEQ